MKSSNDTSRRQFLLSTLSLAITTRLLRADQGSISVDVKVVNVLVSVRDKEGRIVSDLGKGDFVLEEDGREQNIQYFARENDLPLTVGLLVDTSLSQRRVLGEEQSASYRFLEKVLNQDRDRAFVVHFDWEVELLQDLTSSHKRLESALGSLATPEPRQWGGQRSPWPGGPSGPGPGRRGRGGGTLLYDAVFLGSDELMKKQQGRKAMIVLTDGVDTGSRTSLEGSVEAALRADTLIYSVLFADTEMYQHIGGFGGGGMGRRRGGGPSRFPTFPDGKKALKKLSKETGAGFFEVSTKHPIDQTYQRIEEELRNQYSLGYTPARGDTNPGYHKIHVTTHQKGLVVQARDGYYANW